MAYWCKNNDPELAIRRQESSHMACSHEIFGGWKNLKTA